MAQFSIQRWNTEQHFCDIDQCFDHLVVGLVDRAVEPFLMKTEEKMLGDTFKLLKGTQLYQTDCYL